MPLEGRKAIMAKAGLLNEETIGFSDQASGTVIRK
jgi:hypothetical protein